MKTAVRPSTGFVMFLVFAVESQNFQLSQNYDSDSHHFFPENVEEITGVTRELVVDLVNKMKNSKNNKRWTYNSKSLGRGMGKGKQTNNR